MSKLSKPWPVLNTENDVDEFVSTADLSEYDWGEPEVVEHIIDKRHPDLEVHLPDDLWMAVQQAAAKRGVDKNVFVQELIGRGLATIG